MNKVVRLRSARQHPSATEPMRCPRVLDAAQVIKAARVLEAELHATQQRACALETALGLLRESLRRSRGAA